MNPDHLVTKKHINYCQKIGFPRQALSWLKKKPRTWEEFSLHSGELLLKFLPRDMLSSTFDLCVESAPGAALQFAFPFLTKEQRKFCIEINPTQALLFQAFELSEDEFASCVDRVPNNAIQFAAGRLTSQQLENCMKSYPEIALKYASGRLTEEQKAWCQKNLPWYYQGKYHQEDGPAII